MHEIDTLQRKQVTFRQYADKLSVAGDTDMGNVMLGHGQRGIKGGGVGAYADGVGCHQRRDGRLQRQGAVGNDAPQIAQGENAGWRVAVVDNDDTAHMLGVHGLHRLAQRSLGRAGDGRSQRQR